LVGSRIVFKADLQRTEINLFKLSNRSISLSMTRTESDTDQIWHGPNLTRTEITLVLLSCLFILSDFVIHFF